MHPVYKGIDSCHIICWTRYVCLYNVNRHGEYDNNTYMLVVFENIWYYNDIHQRRTHTCFRFGVVLAGKAIYAGVLPLLCLSVGVVFSFIPYVDVETWVASPFTRPGCRLRSGSKTILSVGNDGHPGIVIALNTATSK